MARKKRKAGRRPVESPAPVARPAGLSGGRDAWLLPSLGALALVLGWLSYLGGLSEGRLYWAYFVEGDILHPWRVLDDLRNGLMRLSDYEPPGSWMWIPDFAALWALYALGVDAIAGVLAYSLLQSALAAVGWILVCDFLFGKSPARRAVILVLHAAPFLAVVYNGGPGVPFDKMVSDVFFHQMVPRWRYGIWAMQPWLWWLALRALEAETGRPRVLALLALGLAVAAVAAGEFILLTWFVAPVIAAAAGLAVLGKARWGESALLAGVTLAAFVTGQWLISQALSGDDGLARHGARIGGEWFKAEYAKAMGDFLGALAARNPLETVVWALFSVFALAVLLLALSGRRPGRWPLETPKSRRQVFIALLIPAAMLVPWLAVAATQQIHVNLEMGRFSTSGHRYFLPTLLLPLLVGWALLPWRIPGVSPGAKRGAAVAAAALVAVLAVPRALSISAEGLDPFATPFHKCFAENARRLNWRDGLTPLHAYPQIRANPDAGIERTLVTRVERYSSSAPFIVLESLSHNYRRYGEFQFVVVNGFKGRVFYAFPHPLDDGCPMSDVSECFHPVETQNIVDEATVRAVFGEPAEVVDCEGLGLFHYDPPVRLDELPENPRWRRVFQPQ